MKKLLALALATTAVSAHAWEPNLYLGSNASSWQYSQSAPDIAGNITLMTVEGLAGIELFPYVTIEARAGFGINSDSEDITTAPGIVELEATYYGSFYFRPVIENEKASLYGLLGYTTIEFDGTPQSALVELSQSGLSYGVGVSFVMSPRVDLHAEWRKLILADDMDMRGGSVGFTYTF